MKKIRVEEAIGRELCHDVTEMRARFKGPAFRRGHVIREEDVAHLLDIGKRHVFVWEPDAGEVHEEDAALRLAAVTACDGAHFTPPSEGKVVMIADIDGMLRVDVDLLRAVDSIADVTISTLPDHYPIRAGDRLASMRIVPLTTPEDRIARAEELCRGRALIRIAPYRRKRAGIVITGSEIFAGRIEDRFERVARAKLAAYPCEIAGVRVCDDEVEMIASAAREMIDRGAEILIFSGGMSVDPDDVTPTAIRSLGADVISHGVPSQPGNMTLAAYVGDTVALGVPGAAISMPTTVFDVLLPQIFTDERLTRGDLIRLCDGGLCQLCESCHFPNCTFGRY